MLLVRVEIFGPLVSRDRTGGLNPILYLRFGDDFGYLS